MEEKNYTRDVPIRLPDSMLQSLKKIGEMNNNTYRQCRIMLAGFISVKEKDVDYMDSFMDSLFDFMNQGSDAEYLYRKYLSYLSKLNPEEAKRRFEDLEEYLGYWAPAVYAAAYVARELHSGQVDKGGNDYFKSHLLPVGGSCYGWKTKIVGFLHDAAEDTGYDVDDVILRTKRVLDDWGEHIQERPWEGIFDIDTERLLCEFPGDAIFYPSQQDWEEIAEALNVLNHHTCADREEYIQRIKTNQLALRVKLEDLRNNMDISRIPQPTRLDYERLERYKREYEELFEINLRKTFA